MIYTGNDMKIENNIIKYYLRDTYFITGTAYAGKSTMVKMLADKHDMIFCGENYHDEIASKVKTQDKQPALSYFNTMSNWQEFINRTPEDYYSWCSRVSDEAAEIEVSMLINLSSQGKKIIVDTNIPLELLHEISDYNHVAVMLSPQSMSVDKFFDRSDPEKQFILQQIALADNPAKTMENFRACIAMCNNPNEYNKFLHSGFFTLIREDIETDTRTEVLQKLEQHFILNTKL
jgi:hypothetical protein